MDNLKKNIIKYTLMKTFCIKPGFYAVFTGAGWSVVPSGCLEA
jgi:hypothetical protein